MLISSDLAKAFNQQIGNEFGASMQYVSIAAHFQQRQLTLLSKLFMAQAEEERMHAMKFVQYLLDTKGELAIPSIAAPRPSFASAEDAVAAALREAQEEVGLDPQRVEVLGSLPTYTTGTGFIVTPVVGLIAPRDGEHPLLSLRPDPGEVEEAFEVPLDFLMDPRHHQRRVFDLSGTSLEFFSMPWSSEAGKEYFIWGATAAMLRNLYRFLSA